MLALTEARVPASAVESFKDKAKLSGLFGAHAGGSISWKLYSNKSCDASEGGVLASEGPVSVEGDEIGRASCRERVKISVVAESLKKNTGDANKKEATREGTN